MLKLAPDETLDSLFDGALNLFQPKKGYRFNIDSVILAHEVLRERGIWLDLGCGVGVIALIMAKYGDASKIVGLEVQHQSAEKAARNIQLNNLENKVSVLEGNLNSPPPIISRYKFNGVVCNPPYFDTASTKANAVAEKAVARHELSATLDDIVKFASTLLSSKKKFVMIYPAVRLIELSETLRKYKLEPRSLKFIHGGEGEKAKHVIVRAQKDAKANMEIKPPLIVHNKSGEYTPELKKILHG